MSNSVKALIDPFKKFSHFIAVNLLLGAAVTIIFWSQALSSIEYLLIGTAWGALISLTQWLGHAWISGELDKRVDWMERPWMRAVLGIVCLVVYAIAAFFVVQAIMMSLVFDQSFVETARWVGRNALMPVLISFIIALIMSCISFLRSWKYSEFRLEKIKSEMLTYKYEALRNQINPHFLFNSFNVLSDLVYEDQDLAVSFIKQLSDLYRYVLDSRDKELVPLQHELKFMEGFVFLLKTRFENKMWVESDITSSADEYIVPLSLQMLVENAVKHNEVSSDHPLHIRIERDENTIRVTNNLQIKNVGEDSKKTGLRNLEQQFDMFTNRKIQVRTSQNEFTVELPILKMADDEPG